MTTPEEARQKEIEACDAILSAPWLVAKMIGAEGRRLANANRRFWQTAEGATLAVLAAYLDAEPLRAETESDPDPLAVCPNCSGTGTIGPRLRPRPGQSGVCRTCRGTGRVYTVEGDDPLRKATSIEEVIDKPEVKEGGG